jgi:hypothetical protein
MGERDVTIRRIGEPGDFRWVVMEHGQVYARKFGWDSTFEALVGWIVADYAAETDPTGFALTGEEPHHSFGHDLVGQTYELDLTTP